MLPEEPLLYHKDANDEAHSNAVDCINKFASILKLQAQELLIKFPTPKDTSPANFSLIKFTTEYEKQIISAGNDEISLCKCHLDFIENLLYDTVLQTMITDPIYLFNRGGNAADYKFQIIQYDKFYNNDRRDGMINARKLNERTSYNDGHYIKLPDLQYHVMQFYRDIVNYTENITEDDKTLNGIIKQWVKEKEILDIISPPKCNSFETQIQDNINPVTYFNSSNGPPHPLETQSMNPLTNNESSTFQDECAYYFFCILVGCTMGFSIGIILTYEIGLTQDVTNDDGKTESRPTSNGWVCISSLMTGLTGLFCAVYAFSQSKKTFSGIMDDFSYALTPSESTLNMFINSWSLMAPTQFYAHEHDSFRHSRY